MADFAANCRELGPINDPRIPKPRGKKEAGDAPIRICDGCGTYNHASATHCSHCGREFPRILQLEVKAAKEELIRTPKEPEPIKVEVFKVNRVEYHPHFKKDSAPSIRVTYYCGLRRFCEWICLEHPGNNVRHRARTWWRGRTDVAPPDTTVDALAFVDQLKEPNEVHVRLDLANPQIINYGFAT